MLLEIAITNSLTRVSHAYDFNTCINQMIPTHSTKQIQQMFGNPYCNFNFCTFFVSSSCSLDLFFFIFIIFLFLHSSFYHIAKLRYILSYAERKCKHVRIMTNISVAQTIHYDNTKTTLTNISSRCNVSMS